MAGDVVLFVLCYMFAFEPSIQDPLQAQLYIVGLLFASIGLGCMLGAYTREKKKSAHGAAAKP